MTPPSSSVGAILGLLLCISLPSDVSPFVLPHLGVSRATLAANKLTSPTPMSMTASSSSDLDDILPMTSTSTRRNVIFSVPAATALLLGITASPAFAEEGGIGSDPDHPIAIIGAGGRCGKLCTEILASKKLHVRALTRTGRSILPEASPYVTYAGGDVTSLSSISEALKGCSGAIFTASASKKGGDAAHVDYLGVVNAGKACVAGGVSKYVVVSSLAVTRPDSIGFKITNVFGRIMDYKVAGENELRNVYSSAPASLSYTIVRPGGLADSDPEGPSNLIVSQGDLLSGEISRSDVAQVCIAALLKKQGSTTLEVLNKKGFSKSVKALPEEGRLNELRHQGGASYDALLDGLFTDGEMADKFGDILNDYKGKKVEPLDSIV